MQSVKAATPPVVSRPAPEAAPPTTTVSSTPKLRDYLKAKAAMADIGNPTAAGFVPTVRPVPVGSENPPRPPVPPTPQLRPTSPATLQPPTAAVLRSQCRRLYESHVPAAAAEHCSAGLQGPGIAQLPDPPRSHGPAQLAAGCQYGSLQLWLSDWSCSTAGLCCPWSGTGSSCFLLGWAGFQLPAAPVCGHFSEPQPKSQPRRGGRFSAGSLCGEPGIESLPGNGRISWTELPTTRSV